MQMQLNCCHNFINVCASHQMFIDNFGTLTHVVKQAMHK